MADLGVSLTCSRNAENPISKELIFKNCAFGGPYLEPPFLQFCISPSNACVVFVVMTRKHAQFSSIIAFVFGYTVTKGPPFDLIVLLFPQNMFLCLNLRLMTRDQFIPAKQLNLLAAGWIQFNLHDWFDHGPVDTSRRINIDLDMDDPVHKVHHGKMKIPRTKQDNCPSHSVQKLLSI